MKEPDDIFPLRLSDFETYAFRDDTPAHPMVIILRTPFEGVLNEEVFQDALGGTLQDNPLLRAVVDKSGWQLKWRLLKSGQPAIRTVRYECEDPPFDCPPRHLDLTQSAGVEFELRLCPTRGSLVAYFHHACVDGLGAIRFLGDVFARYGQQTATSDDGGPKVRTPDPEMLLLRGTKRRLRHQQRAPLLHTLMETWRLFSRRSYRLVRHSSGSAPIANEKVRNIVHSRVLPRSVLKQLKKVSGAKGVTLNDLSMMVFLQQISRLSSGDPAAKKSDLFRILMPVSMRSPDHDQISAANVVSYVFHSFRRGDTQSSESLLRAIHKKSQQMLNRNEAVAMLYGFALTRWIPGLFQLSQRAQPDFASAALTNVGEVRRIFENRFPMKQGRAVAGNVTIQRIDGIAPVRENTNLTMAFGTYGGELIMHLNRNAEIFSETDAEVFLDNLTAHLKSIGQTGELQFTNESRPIEDAESGLRPEPGVSQPESPSLAPFGRASPSP